MKISVLILFLITGLASRAQVDKGYELLELVRITEVYTKAPDLSFDIDYVYADSTAPATVLESMSGNMAISGGRFYAMLDSTEFIQGYQYGLAVYYRDEIIVISDRQEFGDVLKLPVLDSTFQQAHVDSMNIVQVNDTTRELTIYFNSGGPFKRYKMRYDARTFLISTISYFIQNIEPETGGLTSRTAIITMNFSAYSTATVDPTLFQEDKFVYKQNGELIQKYPYEDFRLFNNVTIKPVKLYEK